MMPSAFRPFANPFGLIVTMCALASASAAVPLGAGFPWAALFLTEHPGGVLLVAGLTAAFSALVVAASLRTKWFMVTVFAPLGGALVAMLSLGVVFGINLAGETSTAEPMTAADVAWGIGAAVLFGVYAATVGGAVGMLFGICLVIPVAIGAWYLKRPTIDGGARAGLAGAAWLAVVSGLSLQFEPPVDTWRAGMVLGCLGLLTALAVGGASLVHLVVVGAFLSRVRRGSKDGFRIRALGVHDDVRAVFVFANAPRTWKGVGVLEAITLDPLVNPPRPVVRSVALVSLV